jgi:hypothetical protein
MYWEIERYISSVLIGEERTEYEKKIIATLSTQLNWSNFIEILLFETEKKD